MTAALLWKECRLNAEVTLAALVLFVSSFPLAFAGVYMQGHAPFPWAAAIAGGCILNQYFLVLACALLGGTAIAREREDGSVAFLAYLPVPRAAQLYAKLMVCLGAALGLWCLNFCTLLLTQLGAGAPFSALAPFVPRMLGVGVISFFALGASLWAGCRIESALAAAFAGLAATAFCFGGWFIALEFLPAPSYFFGLAFFLLFGTLTAATYLGASLHFLRIAKVRAGNVTASTARGDRAAAVDLRGITLPPFQMLLWKDLRLARGALSGGIVLFALPHVAATLHLIQAGEAGPGFRVASLVGLVLCWVILPWWAGSLLAIERRTGTEDFLAYLPISRSNVLASRLIIAGIPSLSLVGLSLLIFFLAQGSIPNGVTLNAALTWESLNADGFLAGAMAYACAAPVAFGVAWLAAARLRSTALSIILGILAAPVAMACWAIPAMPEGFFMQHFSAFHTLLAHTAAMLMLAAVLIYAGFRSHLQH